MTCESKLGQDGGPLFKMRGICEDSKIKVVDEEVVFFEMKSILNLIIVKDIAPPTLPIQNVRTFPDICKYFIFPFILTIPETKAGGAGAGDSLNTGSIVNSP
jgi:hypothetical protein